MVTSWLCATAARARLPPRRAAMRRYRTCRWEFFLRRAPEEVEALVQVHHLRLGRREAQPQGGQDGGDLLSDRFGVLAGAVDHHDEVVRVADQSIDRTAALANASAPRADSRRLPLLGEVI